MDARLTKLKRQLAKEIKAGRHHPLAARKPVETQPYATKAIGFFVNWDDASLSSLKKNIGKLDILVPEWLHLVDGAGTIREDSPDKTREALQFIHATRPGLPIMERVGSSATIVPGKQPSPSPDKTSRDCSYGTHRNAFAPKKRRHYG